MAELPPPPSPLSSCSQCRGDGVVMVAQGEVAHARLCDCRGPCLRCNGTGRVTGLVEGVPRAGRCICQMLPDRVEIYNRAGIPARYRDASFLQCTRAASEHPEKARALTSSLQWLSSFRPGEGNRGLVLHGKVGRGKTYMLIALIRQLIFTQGVPVRFIEFTRLLSLLRAGYDEGRSDIPIFDQLSTVPVLAIDELGKGRMTEWELTVIDEVVSRRYNAMACIMATTNFEPREPTPGGPPPVNLAQPDQSNQTLGDRVGARVYSRLREICDFAELGGVDFRTTPLALRG